jgi:hypothetical protein
MPDSVRPRILIDHLDNARLSESLDALTIADTVRGICMCQAAFAGAAAPADDDRSLFDRSDVDFGRALTITDGLSGTTIFDGRIAAIGGRFPEDEPSGVVIVAEDRLADLRAARRTRTFEDVTDITAIRQVASGHGLTVESSLSGDTHRTLAQLNQTDLDFVLVRAASLDAVIWMEGSRLRVERNGTRGTAPVTLAYGGSLRALSVTADVRQQFSNVAVGGWSVIDGGPVYGTATGNAISAELHGGRSGASIVETALGARTESLFIVSTDPQHAQARAEQEFRSGARRFIQGKAEAQFEPELRAGMQVELSGVGPLFEGRYGVTAVTHRFDGTRGAWTEFSVERPGIGIP